MHLKGITTPEAFQNFHEKVDISVRAKGVMTNVPEGATGTVFELIQDTYKIKWESGKVETFNDSGGMAMDLDVL